MGSNTAESSKLARARFRERGGVALGVQLQPDVARAVERAGRAWGSSRNQTINELVRMAAGQHGFADEEPDDEDRGELAAGEHASGLTGFGRELRNLRVASGMKLAEMAAKLGVADTWLSAVEFGRQSIHAGWLDIIVEIFSLDSDEAARLRKLAEESQPKARKGGAA